MQQTANSGVPLEPPRLATPSTCWTAVVEAYFSFSGPAPSMILPTGGVDLLFISESGGAALPAVMIHGHVVDAFAPPPVELSGVGIRFRPGGFTAVTGVSQHEVTGGLFDLSDVIGRGLTETLKALTAQKCTRGNPGAMEGVIEQLAPKSAVAPAAVRAVNGAAARPRGWNVSGLALEMGVSTRHLERVSRHYFGAGPKKLARVLRLRRCLRRRTAGAAWADAALESGYADQAHLARDCRSILGVTPNEFLRLWRSGRVFRL